MMAVLSYSAAQGRFKKGMRQCEAKAQILRLEETDEIGWSPNSMNFQKFSK